MSDKPNSAEFVERVAGIVIALSLVGSVGGNAIDKYLERKTSHDKLTTVRYNGEWSRGEYRECDSLNSRAEDVKPELLCIRSSLDSPLPDPFPIPIGRIFRVRSSGDLTYDEEKPPGEIHHWLCRRNNDDVTFSCSAEPKGLNMKIEDTLPASQRLEKASILTCSAAVWSGGLTTAC